VTNETVGLFDCGANKVHGTALLKYRGTEGDPSPFDGPTNYAEYVNIQGTEKAKALLKGSEVF
jgi:hypothetical protein